MTPNNKSKETNRYGKSPLSILKANGFVTPEGEIEPEPSKSNLDAHNEVTG